MMSLGTIAGRRKGTKVAQADAFAATDARRTNAKATRIVVWASTAEGNSPPDAGRFPAAATPTSTMASTARRLMAGLTRFSEVPRGDRSVSTTRAPIASLAPTQRAPVCASPPLARTRVAFDASASSCNDARVGNGSIGNGVTSPSAGSAMKKPCAARANKSEHSEFKGPVCAVSHAT